MGFLGGLAGTLNKVIGQNAEIQRSEEATIRGEDRAALRKFNEADNEEMVDGKLFFTLKGKDGNVIARRAASETELAKREADKLKTESDVLEYKNTIREDKDFTSGLESGAIKAGTTKEDYKLDKAVTRGVGQLKQELETKLPYEIAKEKRDLGYDLTKQTHAGKIAEAKAGGLSGYASTVKAISAGILNGSLDVSSSKYTSGQARQIAAGAQKGIKGYATLLDNLISGRDTKIKKVGTSSGAAAGSDAEADPF